MKWRIPLAVAIVVAGALFAGRDDIRRYLKIRNM